MTTYLRTGAIAGAVGGLVLALFLVFVGESSVDDAIALEEAASAHADAGNTHGAEEALFSRGEQKVGGALGTVLVGVAFGLVFGVVFAANRHRLPGRDDWQRALWLAAAAWLTIHLVPALKYPPNPPAVGNPDTVGDRSLHYVLMIGVSICALLLATRLSAFLRERGWAQHLRLTAAAGVWFAVVAIALATFPPNPDAVTVPAQLIWHFRIKSLSGSLVSWMVIGAAFGSLLLFADRTTSPRADEPTLTS